MDFSHFAQILTLCFLHDLTFFPHPFTCKAQQTKKTPKPFVWAPGRSEKKPENEPEEKKVGRETLADGRSTVVYQARNESAWMGHEKHYLLEPSPPENNHNFYMDISPVLDDRNNDLGNSEEILPRTFSNFTKRLFVRHMDEYSPKCTKLEGFSELLFKAGFLNRVPVSPEYSQSMMEMLAVYNAEQQHREGILERNDESHPDYERARSQPLTPLPSSGEEEGEKSLKLELMDFGPFFDGPRAPLQAETLAHIDELKHFRDEASNFCKYRGSVPPEHYPDFDPATLPSVNEYPRRHLVEALVKTVDGGWDWDLENIEHLIKSWCLPAVVLILAMYQDSIAIRMNSDRSISERDAEQMMDAWDRNKRILNLFLFYNHAFVEWKHWRFGGVQSANISICDRCKNNCEGKCDMTSSEFKQRNRHFESDYDAYIWGGSECFNKNADRLMEFMVENMQKMQDMYSNEMSDEATKQERKLGTTRESRITQMQGTVWTVKAAFDSLENLLNEKIMNEKISDRDGVWHYLTDEAFQKKKEARLSRGEKPYKLDWWPTRGTMLAMLRYGQSGTWEEEHDDIEDDDIDIIIGADSEAEMEEIQRLLDLFLLSEGFDCHTKSSDSYNRGGYRKDVMFCVKRQPNLVLLDFTSYIKVDKLNRAIVHRLCEYVAGHDENHRPIMKSVEKSDGSERVPLDRDGCPIDETMGRVVQIVPTKAIQLLKRITPKVVH